MSEDNKKTKLVILDTDKVNQLVEKVLSDHPEFEITPIPPSKAELKINRRVYGERKGLLVTLFPGIKVNK